MNIASVQVIDNTIVIPRNAIPNAARFRMEVTERAIQVHFDQVELPDPLLVENEAADREMAAFIAMHDQLLKNYPNKFVAIFNGKLIDHADDFWELWERVGQTYPEQYVWVSQVLQEPLETVKMPSIRYE